MHEQSVTVRHNVEMGHRLSLQPNSKCFHLHGHSWWIELELFGRSDDKGMILEFGEIKSGWRSYLDTHFDHHMVLNTSDPLVRLIAPTSYEIPHELTRHGIHCVPFDPTVENMAELWGTWAYKTFVMDATNMYGIELRVQEAATNAATWRYIE